jgi:hypothetical protein
VKIGVISDTHDYFDPAIPRLFEGVDHILHAGDVGMPAITQQLELIAPVTAVVGNTDQYVRLRETELAELDGLKFLVHHIVSPHELTDTLKARIAKDKPDAVVFGHTHKPHNQVLCGVLFFNPGYAGKARFDLKRSVAILHCGRKEIQPEFLPL